ncbi:MAG: type II 3-dehydroquinate dehydratase [Nitrospinae bacterium]|nr:type II 3-dehydroquinate dehydratase [Nitrospinota bacterium]
MAQKILVLNGPNLNLLGLREPHVYGGLDYDGLIRLIEARARELGVEAVIRQSNHEGELVDLIQKGAAAYAGIVINPGAYTHTSVAIRDALLAVSLPTVEVHISNTAKREPFRHHSYIADVVVGTITGLGPKGYLYALETLADLTGAQ